MFDDPVKTLTNALAPDICPGCIHYRENARCLRNRIMGEHYPCESFKPEYFYYDSALHRFWCRHWVDEMGRKHRCDV